MSILTVLALGPLQIMLNERPLASLRQRKPQALLVYLLCHPGQQFSRDHLELLLWSESDKEKARISLRQTLRLLRKPLSAHFLWEQKGLVGLNPAAVYHFDLDQLEEDINLYRGEFLLGFSLKNAPVWDEWLQTQREIVATRYVQALGRLAQGAVSNRQYHLALGHWQRALVVNPWHEQTHRAVMQAYLHLGDRGAALEQYQTLCRLLADDLGAEPDPQTAALAERIRTTENHHRHNLPPSATPFFGRAAEQATLATHLRHPTTQLVTLVGLGGMGKTRLAVEAARELEPSFRDGVWFVDLAATQTARDIPATIANALGLKLNEKEAVEAQLIAALAHDERLLLLDNFEHLLEAGRFLIALNQAAPGIKLLVTSRERLNVLEEQVVSLTGLLGDAAAVQLFIERARRVRPAFNPDAADLEAIASICRLVEGMPLAIEMAAAWVRLLGAAAIANAIENDVRFLQHTQGGVPDRHNSVETVLLHTLELLDVREQAALRALAIFRPGFDSAAAQAVAQCSLFTLLSLVDKSLLQRTDGRYFRLHEQLRQTLLVHTDPALIESLQDRHAAYFLGRLAQYDPTNLANSDAFLILDDMLGNFRLAWQRATEQGDDDLLAQSLAVLGGYFDNRGFLLDLFDLLQPVLTRPRRSDSESRTQQLDARLQRWLGAACRRLGRFDEARVTLQKAIEQAQATGDALLVARCQGDLANTLADAGDLAAAVPAYDELAATFRRLGNRRFLAIALLSKGIVLNRAGRYTEAENALSLVEQESLADDDPHLRGLTNNALGVIAIALGNFTAARIYFERALALFEQTGNTPLAATAYANLATTALHRYELAEAEKQLEAGRIRLRGLDEPLTNGLLLLAQGWLAHMEGNPAAARQEFYAAIERFERAEQPRYLAEAHIRLSRTFTEADQPAAAELHILSALRLAGAHRPTLLAALAEFAIVRLRSRAGQEPYNTWLCRIIHEPAATHETRVQAQATLDDLKLAMTATTDTAIPFDPAVLAESLRADVTTQLSTVQCTAQYETRKNGSRLIH